MRFNFFTKLALCVGAVLTMSSCVHDDDTPNYPVTPEGAYGIIGNASPSSGDLFFFADANQINNQALTFGDAAGYYNFYTGSRVLSVKNSAGTVLDSTTVTLAAGDYFTAFAVNTFDNLELVAYKDSLEYPASGHALVRFINLSPDAPSVNVAGLTQTFATGLVFKAATPFIPVQTGTYDINFTDTATGTALHTDSAVEFEEGRIYTIYTKGFVTPPTASNDTFTATTMRNY